MIARAGWWTPTWTPPSGNLNDSHAAESLLMVRMLGGHPTASAAWVGELDQDGIDFLAEVNGSPVVIRLPWTRRAEVFCEPAPGAQPPLRAGLPAGRLTCLPACRKPTSPDAGALRHGTATRTRPPKVRVRPAADHRVAPITAYTALVVQNHAIYHGIWNASASSGATIPLPEGSSPTSCLRVPSLEAGPSRAARAELVGERRAANRAGDPPVRDSPRDVSDDWPAGFVAHHYVRYLGDLSGGQILRRSLERAYPNAPTAFYTFERIAKGQAVP